MLTSNRSSRAGHRQRKCLQADLAHRDGTAWLGWEDSNSEMSWQNPFERSHRFPVIQPNAGRRDYSRSTCDGGRCSLRTRSSGTDLQTPKVDGYDTTPKEA